MILDQRRLVYLCLFFFTFFSFIACTKPEEEKDNSTSNIESPAQILKIGSIMPLTGAAAQYGHNCMNGIKLAEKEIKQSNSKIKFEILFEDDNTDPKLAVSAFNKLVSVNKVPVVIGPLPSSNTMAVAPLANRNQVVLFSPGSSTPKLTSAGPYVFRNWQSDAFEAKIMADYLLKEGKKRVAILAVNNDFGLALTDYFSTHFGSKGGEIVTTESFEQDATDFRAQLTKIKISNPDGLYLLSYPKETANIVNQTRQMNLTANIYGVAAMEDPSLISLAGNNAEGIIYTKAVEPGAGDPVYNNFVKAYKNEYGQEPGLIADTGYDAVKMLHKAIQKKETVFNGPYIAQQLGNIKDYPGASGLMSFDENGDIIKPVGIKSIRNGQFVWLHKKPLK